MGTAKREAEASSIILAGNFNPAIFQPRWLAAQGLIRKEAGENAQIGIIHPEVTSFSLDWCSLEVQQDKFQAMTLDAGATGLLRDLVIGVLKILEHTPVLKLGMNHADHLSVDSIETWHQVGHTLAPKEYWNSLIESPGMASLTIRGKRPNSTAEFLQVSVQPSYKFRPGVFFNSNEQHDIPGTSQATTAATILEKHYQDAMDYARRVTSDILKASGATLTGEPT